MVRVVLDGLNIYQSRGKWYVYHRPTGRALVRGYVGDRGQLERLLSSAKIIGEYGRLKQQTNEPQSGSLAELMDWYRETERFAGLRERTKSDYERVLTWLDLVGHYPVSEIKSSDIAEMRDRGAKNHGKRFGDYVIQVMSAMFREAVEYGRMDTNPALSVRRGYKASKDANRRWTDQELAKIFSRLPPRLLVPLSLARWAGMRGEDIAPLKRSAYSHNEQTLRYRTEKGAEDVWLPVEPELRDVLTNLDHDAVTICANALGRPWASVNALRKCWGDWKAKNEVPKDLTLHGLRVTFASVMAERGADAQTIAAMIGDKSEAMGSHYARGADTKAKINRLFGNAK